jgi:hypothetical protein
MLHYSPAALLPARDFNVSQWQLRIADTSF